MTEAEPIYLRPSRAKETVGISRSKVYALAREGKLTIHKHGNTSLVLISELRAALEGTPKEDPA